MNIIVTGGAGFIGSAVIRYIINFTKNNVINVDKLTYAGNLESLIEISDSDRYCLETIDICDEKEVQRIFMHYQPDVIMHLAAESHVDRSIDGPRTFIESNIVGTYTLLEASRRYWASLDANKKSGFRFLHISTDEVFGDLRDIAKPFTEAASYNPSNPYSASKASSDHLARAWHRTYGLPVIVANCSNNYGPYQFPEKLIPCMILSALNGKPMPVYGRGNQIRDWLYVDDNARALYYIVTSGKIGESYNIGSQNEKSNLEVVSNICTLLEELVPVKPSNIPYYSSLISFVEDRPGHDTRYAMDANKIMNELKWVPQETFETGLRKTVQWYLSNQDWCLDVLDGSFGCERLGINV